MGKLADALKKKYRTPREALEALGLDPSLIDIKRLAADGALKRGRDDNVLADLVEQPGGHQRWNHGPEADGDPALGDEAEEDDGETESAEERLAERRRQVRRMSMGFAARDCLGRGMSHDETREHLQGIWPMPDNALEGGMGGALAGDDEEATSIAEDIDHVMSKLDDPEVEDRHMAKDRRRQLALDRKRFDEWYPALAKLAP
jgi:hypothetical protein